MKNIKLAGVYATLYMQICNWNMYVIFMNSSLTHIPQENAYLCQENERVDCMNLLDGGEVGLGLVDENWVRIPLDLQDQGIMKQNLDSSFEEERLPAPQDTIDILQQPEQSDLFQISSYQPITVPFHSLHSQIKQIISFFVNQIDLEEKELYIVGMPLYQHSQHLSFIFKNLMNKFKKLKKTKEQMTKYCMRKAFKYIGEFKKKKKKKVMPKEEDDSLENTDSLNFQMPFKKNSSEKTINCHFLKAVFQDKEFVAGYRQFLDEDCLNQLISEDNQSKIVYLTKMIEDLIEKNQLQKLENIKRLPWTQPILNKVKKLSIKLLEYTDNTSTEPIK